MRHSRRPWMCSAWTRRGSRRMIERRPRACWSWIPIRRLHPGLRRTSRGRRDLRPWLLPRASLLRRAAAPAPHGPRHKRAAHRIARHGTRVALVAGHRGCLARPRRSHRAHSVRYRRSPARSRWLPCCLRRRTPPRRRRRAHHGARRPTGRGDMPCSAPRRKCHRAEGRHDPRARPRQSPPSSHRSRRCIAALTRRTPCRVTRYCVPRRSVDLTA